MDAAADPRSSFPADASVLASPPTFAVGDVVAQRFRVLALLGEGGLGRVYAARDLELGGQVALKTLRPDIGADAGARASLHREVALAGQMRHRHLCRIHGLHLHTVADGAWPLVTMEWLHGETLASRLERSGPLPTRRARLVALEMARALRALHGAGIVHGDITPANIFLALDPDGTRRTVLMDFGLARISHPTPAEADVGDAALPKGTAAYMSPEQIQGEEPTPASDHYALGLVLYETLTSVVPFYKLELAATLKARLTGRPLPPRLLCRTLDASFEAVVLRCLEREPADRFASSVELIQALEGDREAPTETAMPSAPREEGNRGTARRGIES